MFSYLVGICTLNRHKQRIIFGIGIEVLRSTDIISFLFLTVSKLLKYSKCINEKTFIHFYLENQVMITDVSYYLIDISFSTKREILWVADMNDSTIFLRVYS